MQFISRILRILVDNHDTIASFAQVVAIFGAAIALFYWSQRGSLHPGMTVKLNASRTKMKGEENDFLNVVLSLSNPWQVGKVSFALLFIDFHLTSIPCEKDTEDTQQKTIFPRRGYMEDENRFVWKKQDYDDQLLITIDKIPIEIDYKSSIPINLARGDSTHFSHVFHHIDSSKAYIVEAIIIATNPKGLRQFNKKTPTMHWRASLGVLPEKQ